MPQVSAAALRSAPSSTIARASIRRAAEPSFSRPAAARSSAAVKSTRVIATAPPIDVCSSLMSKHRVRVSSIWKSQNESKAAAVGISDLRPSLQSKGEVHAPPNPQPIPPPGHANPGTAACRARILENKTEALRLADSVRHVEAVSQDAG